MISQEQGDERGSLLMPYALVDGKATRPQLSGQRGLCPECGTPALARCGEILQWHWAHVTATDCVGYTPMTLWHCAWQERFPEEMREIVAGAHRADVKLPDGTVIEFQHSQIDPATIRDREAAHGRMLWMLDARDAFAARRLTLNKRGAWASFVPAVWNPVPRLLSHYRAPVVLDLGDGTVLDVKSEYAKVQREWGFIARRMTADEFVATVLGTSESTTAIGEYRPGA